MDIESLRLFLTLSEELNFTCASARSHISQPALSRRIQQIEREAGREFFTRSSHSVSLTPAGERFKRHAVRLVEVFDAGLADIRSDGAHSNTRIRLGVFHPGAAELTGPIIANFRKRCPAVPIDLVDITSADTQAALLGGRVDVALVWGPIDDRRVAARELLSDARAVAVAEGHPLVRVVEPRMADVDRHAVARITLERPNWRGWSGTTGVLDIGRPVYVSTFEQSLRAAMMGAAVSWAPHRMARYSPLAGLRYLPVADAARIVVSVVSARGDKRPHVQSFAMLAEQTARRYRAINPPGDPSNEHLLPVSAEAG